MFEDGLNKTAVIQVNMQVGRWKKMCTYELQPVQVCAYVQISKHLVVNVFCWKCQNFGSRVYEMCNKQWGDH